MSVNEEFITYVVRYVVCTVKKNRIEKYGETDEVVRFSTNF
jgi:hypothetical protein